MKIYIDRFGILLFLVLVFLITLKGQAYGENLFSDVSALSLSKTSQVVSPVADAGQDLVTDVFKKTLLKGHGTSMDNYVVKYEWDFNGDGQYDWASEKSGLSSHYYKEPGNYNSLFRVTDSDGNFSVDSIEVQVYQGNNKQNTKIQKTMEGSLVKQNVVALAVAQAAAVGDGIIEKYAVMINGANESRFWDDVTFMYSTLVNDYHFLPEFIYLLNYNGKDAFGGNPNNMIDYSATKTNIDNIFAQLGGVMDSDDELFIWITGHGRGYNGPASSYYGYMDGTASVDPGDEMDYLESEFKLRSFYTGGNYSSNHGMEAWKVYYKYYSAGNYRMWRQKYVSHFQGTYFEAISNAKSDNDVFIEKFTDYLAGDYNRNGIVEVNLGEVYDFDGDGVPPYDPSNDLFDEDDWGRIDFFDDDLIFINTQVPGSSYIIFDANLDNYLDIDIDYDINILEVDGTDLDNQGFFDGIDVNSDGDMDDWISIDESIQIYGDTLSDDELGVFLNRINASVISIVAEPCFSGGLIEDLSGPSRIISTASTEENLSYGNLFINNFTSALHLADIVGTPVNADFNGNGLISMQEAFNYATLNDYYNEIPQYDDNGDGLSHTYPIPGGGDGALGANMYLVPSDFDGDGYNYYTDCNDNDPSIYPGAVENCNDGIDNDCDGLIDFADPDAVNCLSPNADPVVDAGADITVASADVSTTVIQGTVTDADVGDTLLCTWEDDNLHQLTSIMSVGPNGECPLDLSTVAIGAGFHTLTLYGLDGTVVVQDIMTLLIDTDPVADAGADIAISAAEVSTTIVQGTVTDAYVGAALLCAWEDDNLHQLTSIMSVGPNGECPLDLNALSLGNGTFTLTLYGIDSNAVSSDSMILTINNAKPVVDAGLDIAISGADVATTIILGTVTDANIGDTLLCAWEDDNLHQLTSIMSVGPNGECPLDLSTTAIGIGSHTLTLYGLDATAIVQNNMILTIY